MPRAWMIGWWRLADRRVEAIGAQGLHIAYYSPAWPPAGAANGIVTYISVIRDYLLRRGHEVSVLSDGTLHLSNGATHILESTALPTGFWPKMISRIDRRLGHHPFTARRLARQLRRACAIVPIELVEMEETFGWSHIVAQHLKLPVVTRLHGPQFLKPAGADPMVPVAHAAHRERAEGRAIRHARALTAPTGAMLAATYAHYKCASPRARIIPNPISASATRERWSIDRCEADTILCVGRVDAAKGADVLVDAFARVLEARPTARLVMVGPEGQAKRADGTGEGFLAALLGRTPAHVFDRIEFTGLLAPGDIAALRRRAFVTVVASPNENFPYAAVEAMAAGCPLISTDWPGASEIIVDGESGWLTPVGNSGALAAKILWVLAHPDVAARIGASAWQRSHTTFSVESVGAQMLDFYRDVLADDRRSR